jgi:chromosome segregation ATPase
VHNFKQFKGTKKIGPFENFTSVIGANGTGKSSVLEAIAFGLAISNPRFEDRNCASLKSYGADPKDEMYVELIFEPENSPNVFVKRTISF